MPPQPYGQPMPPPMPPPQPAPQQDQRRGWGELSILYGSAAAYGAGTGIWFNALTDIKDPGLFILAPVALGVGMPVGVFAWDQYGELHRGVPGSISMGLLLGGVEGIGIAGVQAQHSKAGSEWTWRTDTTMTFLTATGGGLGGYAFGEWIRPDTRSLWFIGSGGTWGALTGGLFGAGLTARNGDWKDGASVAGLIGYNAGIAATGVLSTWYVPSWNTQRWMWVGYGAGVAGTSIVYVFYLAAGSNASNGLIANAIGGVGGLTVASVLAAYNTDDDGPRGRMFKPPFNLTIAPNPGGGASVSAFGQF